GEQRGRGVSICGLEETEHRRAIVVGAVMEPIVDRADPADDPAVAPGEKELDVGVLEERILLRSETLTFADPERRDPVRGACMALVRMVDELPELAPVAHGTDVDGALHADIMIGFCLPECGRRNGSRPVILRIWRSCAGCAPCRCTAGWRSSSHRRPASSRS